MAFETIGREDFDRFLPPQLVLETLRMEQVEWFANPAGNIIGTIAGKVENGWKYAVLARDRRGDFRVCNLGGDSYNLAAARSRCLIDMRVAEKTAETLARQENMQAGTGRRL